LWERVFCGGDLLEEDLRSDKGGLEELRRSLIEKASGPQC
jgi:hypothetical protein